MQEENPAHRLAGPNGDLQRVLETLEAAIISLIEHPEMISTLQERCEARIAAVLEERINSYSSLTPYVQETWSTVAKAHVGVPLVEHLYLQLIEDAIFPRADVNDPTVDRLLEAHAAFSRLLDLAALKDSHVADAKARIESDLHAFHADDREWRWLNEAGED